MENALHVQTKIGMYCSLLCSVALAIWLGQIMNSLALGFLSAAGVFIVLAAVVYFLFGPAIRNFITLSIINTIHEKD